MTKELKNIERIDGSTIESNLIERQLGFESPGDGLSQEHYKLKYKTRNGQVISFIPEGGEATYSKVNLTTVEDDNDAATKKYVDDKCEESNITTVRPHLTGFVSPDDVDLHFDVPNHHLFLKPKLGKSELQYYINGKLYTLKTRVDQVLDNSVVGHFYAYLNANGQIEYSQEWKETLLPLISGFRVSNNLGEDHTTAGDINNEYLSLIAAYNGTAMDKATREYQECNVGTWIEAGCSVTIAENKATFGRSAGTLVHGDIATDLIGNDSVKPAIGYLADSLTAKYTIKPSSNNWLTEHGSSVHGSLYQGATKTERAPLGEGVWYLYFARPDMRSGLWSDIIIPVEGHSSFQNRYKGIDATVRNVASKYIDFIGEWKVMGLLFLQNDSIADFIDLAAFQVKDLLYCGMLERTLTTIEDDQNLSEVLARGNDAGGQDIVGVRKIGVGTDSPITMMSLSQNDLGSDWLGTPSQLSVSATDAQLDLVSTEGATWGSGIQLKQVDAESKTYDDAWGIRRETSKKGLGNGSLNVTYGEDRNSYINPKIAKFHTDGSCELPLAENSIIDARGEKAVTTKKYVDAKYDTKVDVDGTSVERICESGPGTELKWFKLAEFSKTAAYANFNATWQIQGRDITPFELYLKTQGSETVYTKPELKISCKYANPDFWGLTFKLVISDEAGSKFSLFVRRSGSSWNNAYRAIKQSVNIGYIPNYMLEDSGTTEPTGHEVLTASISENFEMLPESQGLNDVLSRGNDAGEQTLENVKGVKSSDVMFQGLTASGQEFSAQILGGEWDAASEKYIATQTTYRPVLIQTAQSGYIQNFVAKSIPTNIGEPLAWDETLKINPNGTAMLPRVDKLEVNAAGPNAITTKEYVDDKLKNPSVGIPKTSLQAGQEYFIAYAKGGGSTNDYQVYSGDIDITFSMESNSHHNQVNIRVTKVLNEFVAKTTNQLWYAAGNGKHCLGNIRIYKSSEWHGGMLISIIPNASNPYTPVFEGVFSTTKPSLWTAITPTTTRPVEASNATILAMDLQSKSGYSVFNSNKSSSFSISDNGTATLEGATPSEIEIAGDQAITTKKYVDDKVANITETQGLSDVLSKGNDAGGQDIVNVRDIDNAKYSFIGDTDTGLSKSVWSGTSVFGKNGSPKVVVGHLNQLDPNVNGAVVGAHTSGLQDWDQLTFGATNYRFFNGLNKQIMTLDSNGFLILPQATTFGLDNAWDKAVVTKGWVNDNYVSTSILNNIKNVVIQDDGPHNLVAGKWYYITWTQGNNPCNLKAYYEFVGPGIGINIDLHLLVKSAPTGILTYSGNYSPIDKFEILTQSQDHGFTWCVRVYCSRDCTLNARYQVPFEFNVPGENFYPPFYKGCNVTNPVSSADKSYFYEYVKTYAGYSGAKSRTRLIQQKSVANIDVKISESDRGNISFRGSASSQDNDAILNFTPYGGINTIMRVSIRDHAFDGSVTSETPYLSTSLYSSGHAFELSLGYFSTMTGDISWQKIGTEFVVNGRAQITTVGNAGFTNVKELVFTCNSRDITNLTIRSKDANTFDHFNFDVEEY